MTKMTGYNYDAITNTLTMTAAFAKKASLLNTPEYNTVRQLRLDNPGMKIEKAAPKTSSNHPVTFKQMEEFIAQCRNCEDRQKTFQKVKALSRVQASPYAYVRKWFMENYANYSAQPKFDKDGFVVVKTKKEMIEEAKAEAEKKLAEEAAAAEAQEEAEGQEQGDRAAA